MRGEAAATGDEDGTAVVPADVAAPDRLAVPGELAAGFDVPGAAAVVGDAAVLCAAVVAGEVAVLRELAAPGELAEPGELAAEVDVPGAAAVAGEVAVSEAPFAPLAVPPAVAPPGPFAPALACPDVPAAIGRDAVPTCPAASTTTAMSGSSPSSGSHWRARGQRRRKAPAKPRVACARRPCGGRYGPANGNLPAEQRRAPASVSHLHHGPVHSFTLKRARRSAADPATTRPSRPSCPGG